MQAEAPPLENPTTATLRDAPRLPRSGLGRYAARYENLYSVPQNGLGAD